MAGPGDQEWQTVKGITRKGRGDKQHSFDIATDMNFNKDDKNELTTFYFTNFPEKVWG
jgi:hypothetical protein